eukprot:288233-Karenia_brevis.AAC.1
MADFIKVGAKVISYLDFMDTVFITDANYLVPLNFCLIRDLNRRLASSLDSYRQLHYLEVMFSSG